MSVSTCHIRRSKKLARPCLRPQTDETEPTSKASLAKLAKYAKIRKGSNPRLPFFFATLASLREQALLFGSIQNLTRNSRWWFVKYFKDQQGAINTHEIVGTEVREAIRRIGGTLPEQLPPAEHIKYVEKWIKSTAPKLELDEKDAKGLIGEPEEDI